jgi:hypothetical protein
MGSGHGHISVFMLLARMPPHAVPIVSGDGLDELSSKLSVIQPQQSDMADHCLLCTWL